VTVVLSAYNPSTWQVLVAPGTNLKKVILAGYHTQSVEVPKGVEVVHAFHEGAEHRGQNRSLYLYYNIESTRFRSSAQAVRKFTGMELSSFQGTYNYDATKPIHVNVVQNDERLRSDYPRLTPTDQVPALKFNATRLLGGEFGFSSALYGEFTKTGPQKKTLEGLPDKMLQVAYDPAAKQYYGITGHELHAVNMKDGTSLKIEPPAGVDPNWLRALTFDAKRDRVIISGRNSMYEYSTKNGVRWAVLVPNRKGSFAGLAWQASTDTLYAIGDDSFGSEKSQAMLYELNARGAVVDKTPLTGPMFMGVLQLGPSDMRAELIDLGGDLAAIIYREGRDPGTGERGKPETFLYVIDPKTGKTKLAWKE
jgi:hypothetical protein